jgi:hypothetical protein
MRPVSDRLGVVGDAHPARSRQSSRRVWIGDSSAELACPLPSSRSITTVTIIAVGQSRGVIGSFQSQTRNVCAHAIGARAIPFGSRKNHS